MAPSRQERRRIVVDGSNIATEGRTLPSLAQLDDAIRSFLEEYVGFATTDVTVVVDASFGHRIDPSEVPAFELALEHGEMVTPPAGAVGRGDGFILRIAEKSGALVLSNDSFQEFHAERPWLFEPGRLIGGKPVPGVGWVFTPRTPVRGVKSRAATTRAKRNGAGAEAVASDGAAGTTKKGAAKKKAAKATAPAADGVKATKAGKAAKADKAGKSGKAAKATKTAKPDKADKSAKAGKGDKGTSREQPAKTAGATSKSGRAAKLATAATPASSKKAAAAGSAARKTRGADTPDEAGSVNGRTPGGRTAKSRGAKAAASGSATSSGTTSGTTEKTGKGTGAASALNDPVTFLSFVANHPIGSTFDGTVVSFTSHGAHIEVDGMLCHVPLRGLGDPPPSRARQVLAKGETRPFVLVSLDAARRRAALALPGLSAS